MKQPDSSALAPTSWEALAVFRETFLRNLPPKDAEAYCRMGRRMYFDRIEAFLLEDAVRDQSLVQGDLASAADGSFSLHGARGPRGRPTWSTQRFPRGNPGTAFAGEDEKKDEGE